MDAKNISKERDKIDKFVNLRLLTLKCEAFVVVTGMLEEDEGSCPGGGEAGVHRLVGKQRRTAGEEKTSTSSSCFHPPSFLLLNPERKVSNRLRKPVALLHNCIKFYYLERFPNGCTLTIWRFYLQNFS